jgi:hypothetical protein
MPTKMIDTSKTSPPHQLAAKIERLSPADQLRLAADMVVIAPDVACVVAEKAIATLKYGGLFRSPK